MAKSSGGGINSRNVKSVSVRTGSAARAQNPRGVSQIGQALSNHATDTSKRLTKSVEPVRGAAMPGVKLGNELATNVGGGGPGTGRTTMRSGSQQGLTPAKPMAAGHDILNDFGPDSAGVRGRR
jgi:hypothetical protein